MRHRKLIALCNRLLKIVQGEYVSLGSLHPSGPLSRFSQMSRLINVLQPEFRVYLREEMEERVERKATLAPEYRIRPNRIAAE